MVGPAQQGILIRAGKAAEALQVSLPPFKAGEDASKLYAHLFDATEPSTHRVDVQELPINAHLPSDDRLLLLHASSSTSQQHLPENRLASEVLLEKVDCASIQGDAYVFYSASGRDLFLRKDWQALHDVCYGARLANIRKSQSHTVNLEDLAKQFLSKRDEAISQSEEVDMEEEHLGESGGDWTDEEVEKPREPKKEIDSDDEDQEMDDNQAEEGDNDEQEEEEDSEGSYEDESELESDDDDDPRKKALLEMIQAAIMKDGKLDLERLGLVEKNGKLVPKDD